MLRLTPVVSNLILINVVVFVIQMIMPGVTGLLALYNVASPNFQPYQLFTYMFSHSGFFHIFFNMLMFSFCGPAIEDYWGQKKFLIFYLASGIGAGIFNILMDVTLGLGSFSQMIGASGAVYGVMTAFGIIYPNMELRFMLIPFSFKAKYLVLVLGSMAIISGFRGSPGDNVAHFAHLGGIVVAIILIQFWRSTGKG
jgi:membrane associated rhomboid family serine protease